MTAAKPALLVVTGLQREARIAAGDGIVTLCSGSNPELLRERLSALVSARPRESGDPAQESWIPAFAGMNGGEICGVLSFGLAGGLAPDLQPGDMVLATLEVPPDRWEAVQARLDELLEAEPEVAVHVRMPER